MGTGWGWGGQLCFFGDWGVAGVGVCGQKVTCDMLDAFCFVSGQCLACLAGVVGGVYGR